LRRAFVANLKGGRLDVRRVRDHQIPRFNQAKLLLILQRRHRGERLELAMELRRAHLRCLRKLRDTDRLGEAFAQGLNRGDDAPGMAIREHHLRDVASMGASQ